ncbi:MAG TPA: long-chain fatty acid--CoA ligase [Actinobacteria bacterium]|nr:long-chain fatty acid--CoA ligase [Actinomycetota bacterium]
MTTTLPQTGTVSPATRLRDFAARTPDTIALREKSRGIWREFTWAQFWDQAETFAHALLASDIDRGDRVAIHSDNRPEWLFTDLGSIAGGAACMGLYPTNPTAEVEYLLDNSGSRLLIVEDEEQADKVLAIPTSDLPMLEKIIYLEHRGVDAYDDPRLMSWDAFMELGRAHRSAHPDAVAERMAGAKPEDLAYLVYTSGTTGPPKGSMITLANLDYATREIAGDQGIVQPGPGPDDLIVSYLPLCHIYEKLFSVVFNTGAGVPIHFGESLDTLVTDMRDVQPTIVQGVPRIWERIHAAIQVRLASASRLKRINAAIWMTSASYVGNTLARREGRHTAVSRGLTAIGNLFLFRSLKDRVGLRRVRYGVSAAAPIAPEILQFFMSIGVPLHEAYGMTENCGVATTNRPGRIKLGTVGEPYPGVELRLDAETGEILTRHPAVFAGYWSMPEATERTIDPEGWLHTGDVGEWVDGTHVKIIDRIKDIIITSGGKNVSPSEIENTLKTSPFIKEAIIIGDRRKFLAALIGIDFEVVSEWAQRHKLPHTTYRDLSEKPEVVTLVQKAVDAANQKFARVEQIKAFRLLTKELDHEEGELTATQKVKRSVVEKKFSDMIESMYR